MKVLSLFDGMSCLQIALNRIGIVPDVYYASEVDKYAMTVTMNNFPNTIQLGDVRTVKGSDLGFIDLLGGGSPCQSFSFAGKRKGMSTTDNVEILTLDHYLELKAQNFEFEGQSYLFWEYMRILNELREINPNIKFLLENVMMGEKWQKVLTQAIGINPIMINSSLVSAQSRRRLYWTNIGAEADGLFGDLACKIPQPKDKGLLLRDILESEVDEKYYLSDKMIAGFDKHAKRHNEKGTGFGWTPTTGNKKASCIRANSALAATDNIIKIDKKGKVKHNQDKASCFTAGGHLTRSDGKTYCLDTGQTNAVESNFRIRRLTPIECERLQTVPFNYTSIVSDSQRYKMLGNGWTVDVVAYILSFMK